MIRKPRHLIGLGLLLVFALAGVLLLTPDRAQPLPEFATIEDTVELKQRFFEYLAPQVEAENQRVLEQRERLLEIAVEIEAGGSPGWLDRRWLRNLAREYEVEWPSETPGEALETLKRRVDKVPVPLALVQAATESGWGRSRFAVEANNLFGHWCYVPGCGLVPEARRAGARHEVAEFSSVRHAVSRYLHNLNTHEAYLPLRVLRAAQRAEGEVPRAGVLVDGLLQYSERREAYVEEIRSTIDFNRPLIERVINGDARESS